MHSKGIVHRDIKPENMLFEKKTKLVKIIDFGISTKLEAKSFLNCRVGTPYYIAPEVLNKKYDQKCDIWSLGIVLYMIIYRVPPFKGESPLQVMESVARDEIIFKNPIHYNYSNQALEFLRRLLVKNPMKRPSAEDALQHKWLQCRESTENQDKSNKVLERITKFHVNLETYHSSKTS